MTMVIVMMTMVMMTTIAVLVMGRTVTDFFMMVID